VKPKSAPQTQDGRSALVVGGSSGIGFAIARALRSDGFEITIAARALEKLAAASEELGALAVQMIFSTSRVAST
jgi:NADP-dependent 3-hydroxy acid dehydrogenase YdfG